MERIDKNDSEWTFEELSIELTHRCPLNCIYCSGSADIVKDEFIDLNRLFEKSVDNILSVCLYLGAHIVPFKANYKLLPEIVDCCLNKFFNEVSFLRFVPQGRGINRDLFNTRAEFAYINESMKSILQRIQNEKIKIDIRLAQICT